MPIIQPPPYQDRADSQRWAEWYRLINERLSNISISIGAIDDVDITTPVTDNDVLRASGGIFVNEQLQIVWDTTPQLGGDLDTNGNHIWFDTDHGIKDSSGNEQLLFKLVASAINYFEITNSATTNAVQLKATGQGATVPMTLTTKGNGDINLTPDGTGDVVLDGVNWPQADGTDGQVLKTDGVGQTSWADPNTLTTATTSVTAATHTHAATERYLLCDTSSNAITVNLVAAATAGDGYRLDIKSVDATNNVTIDGSGSETIDGATTAVLTTQYENISLVCDGSNWHIL
jgi:hypothetical protein